MMVISKQEDDMSKNRSTRKITYEQAIKNREAALAASRTAWEIAYETMGLDAAIDPAIEAALDAAEADFSAASAAKYGWNS